MKANEFLIIFLVKTKEVYFLLIVVTKKEAIDD